MTENPNEKPCLPQFYSQIKRQLTNSTYNEGSLHFTHPNDISNQLTDSNLKYNVQIVLDNLKRNVSRSYLNERNNNIIISGNNNTNNNNYINFDKNKIKNNKKCCSKNCNKKMSNSPESDCNSNLHLNAIQQLGCSIASSQDFTHDNSDYQWFIDYG